MTMVFMAVVIPVVLHGVSLANRAAVFAERKEAAARTAERLLDELILTDEWQSGAQSGVVTVNRIEYEWKLISESWLDDSMTQLTLVVFFTVQGQQYESHLSALVETETTSSESTETSESGQSS
ncbi:MAG: hypothetical protein GC154_14935 [bacterium]|nr:hypothetical protein [bacterium]